MKTILSQLILPLILLFSSCNSSSENDKQASLSDTTSIYGMTGDAVKLVKTASINFKVKDVEKSARSVSKLAQESGGMIFNQDFESVEGERNELKISKDSLLVITSITPQADIMARIPSENLEAFMYSVTDLGYFTGSSQLHIDDRSLTYLENALKQKVRKEVVSQTDIQKNKPSENFKTVVLSDEAIDRQIQNTAIEADARYSTVNLRLSQNPFVRREIIANYIVSDYQLPFSSQLRNAFSDGWGYFQSFILILSQLWMFILTGVVAYFLYQYRQLIRKSISANLKA